MENLLTRNNAPVIGAIRPYRSDKFICNGRVFGKGENNVFVIKDYEVRLNANDEPVVIYNNKAFTMSLIDIVNAAIKAGLFD